MYEGVGAENMSPSGVTWATPLLRSNNSQVLSPDLCNTCINRENSAGTSRFRTSRVYTALPRLQRTEALQQWPLTSEP